MKTKQTADALLEEMPLGAADAARLILEIREELGEIARDKAHGELMRLMRRVIRAGVAALRQEEHTVSFAEAAWASIAARHDRRAVTLRDLRCFVRRMLRVEGVSARPLRAMTTRECRELLHQAFAGSMHSYRKGRAILHSIFSFGFRQEWCDSNPVDRIEAPRTEEKEIVPLSLQEVRRLEETAATPEFADMRLPLHLMLYCGVRPAEMQRIDPRRDINCSERTLTIRPAASKTGGGRIIPLRALARPGLTEALRQLRPISASRWRSFRRRAGFRRWVPDVLRHTFATYHAVHFRNLPELQLEMGHRDVSLLRTRYVNAGGVSKRDAAAFWKAQET